MRNIIFVFIVGPYFRIYGLIYKALKNKHTTAILAIGCSVLNFISCSEKEDKILPVVTNITESVYSSVTVQPDSLYQVYAAVAGIIENNLLEEGDTVQKGSPVIQIINNAPKLNTANARLNLELARDNYDGSSAVLKGMLDEIQAAELGFVNDSINFYRQKRLWEQQIGSQVEYENRKLAFELSKRNLAVLKNAYERAKSELKMKVQQAENNLKTSLINTEDFTVASKINGTLYALYKNPGEVVSAIEPLAAIGSTSSFVIEMLVDEVDIVKLKNGQRALVTLDAYKDQVFDAVVHKIYPRKDERSQTFKIEAVFRDPPNKLYPGLAGEGNIIIAEREEALTIPKDYLIENNKVLTDAGEVEVKIGLQNLDRVEITEGLDATTHILKPEE